MPDITPIPDNVPASTSSGPAPGPEKSIEAHFADAPLFMTELPTAEGGDNDAISALQALVFDETPDGTFLYFYAAIWPSRGVSRCDVGRTGASSKSRAHPPSSVPPFLPHLLPLDDAEVARNFKEQGNEYFAGRRFREAQGFYTQAIDAKPEDPSLLEVLLVNRAACNLALGTSRLLSPFGLPFSRLLADLSTYPSTLSDPSQKTSAKSSSTPPKP